MALRDVNLIAADVLERRYLLRHLWTWCGCIALVTILMITSYGYLTRVMYPPRQSLTSQKSNSHVLAEMVAQITRDQRELTNALRERAQFSALTEKQLSYASVMAKLAEIMNERTWLQQLTMEPGRDRVPRLRLMGSSVSHETLGDFMQRLSGDPLFSAVTLKSAQEPEMRIAGESRVHFQIECDIARK